LKGQVEIIKFKSKILKDNPLKDPDERDLITYLPEKYLRSYSKGYPVIFFTTIFWK